MTEEQKVRARAIELAVSSTGFSAFYTASSHAQAMRTLLRVADEFYAFMVKRGREPSPMEAEHDRIG